MPKLFTTDYLKRAVNTSTEITEENSVSSAGKDITSCRNSSRKSNKFSELLRLRKDVRTKKPLETTLEHNRRLVIAAALTGYAYPINQNIDRLRDRAASPFEDNKENETTASWKTTNDVSEAMSRSTGIGITGEDGSIVDRKTGLVAFILQNDDTKEIQLVFGGTNSDVKGTGKRDHLKMQWAQVKANAGNAVSDNLPENLSQASILLAALMTILSQDSRYQEYSLAVSGHSKGGAEAQFAVAMNSTPENPVSAQCFGSAELGRGAQRAIAERFNQDHEEIKAACSGITTCKVQGDPVPLLSRTMVPVIKKIFAPLTLVGNVTTISPVRDSNGRAYRHLHFLDAAKAHEKATAHFN